MTRAALQHACNPSTAGRQVVSFVLGIAAVLWTTLSSSLEHRTFGLGAGAADSATGLKYRYDFFHLIFMLASCYVAMLFVGWSLNEVRWSLNEVC